MTFWCLLNICSLAIFWNDADDNENKLFWQCLLASFWRTAGVNLLWHYLPRLLLLIKLRMVIFLLCSDSEENPLFFLLKLIFWVAFQGWIKFYNKNNGEFISVQIESWDMVVVVFLKNKNFTVKGTNINVLNQLSSIWNLLDMLNRRLV